MTNRLRIHCFQQVAVEGLGCIQNWIDQHKHTLNYTRFYANDALPLVDDFDMLIVMGGPMSVYEEDKYPWLIEEKRVISEAIDAGKIVLGICLGSQFVAAALGANVYPGKQTEIGWHPLQLTQEGKASVLSSLEHQTVFHWHGDTFDIPSGAELLASSAATPHQAFKYKNTLALQFHLEVTEESLTGMCQTFASHLVPSQYVHTAEEILSRKEVIKKNNQLMFELLDEIVK